MTEDLGALLLTPEGIQDPYPVYDRIRATGPVYWSDALRMWLVTSHEAAREVYRDHERFSSAGANIADRLSRLPDDVRDQVPTVTAVDSAEVLNVADPPRHTRHRAFFTRPLAPRRLSEHREWFERLCRGFADELAERDEADLVADFSTPLAYAVILELFGSPLEHVPVYRRTTDAFFAFHSVGGATPDNAFAYEEALRELRATLEGLYAELRARDADDSILASLLQPVDGADTPDELELFVLMRKFFAAGHENLIHTVSVTVMELLRHPEQLAAARADQTFLRAAYEEAIRWEPPNQGNRRIATDAMSFFGQVVKRGDSVMAMKAAAARDPAAYTVPNTFDPSRDQNEPPGGSIAFGQGPHFCVGAGLARLVGPLAVRTVLDRFPALRLPAGWQPEWTPTPLRRTLTALPLVLR
jgi:cytochrome P450